MPTAEKSTVHESGIPARPTTRTVSGVRTAISDEERERYIRREVRDTLPAPPDDSVETEPLRPIPKR
jgi:hypothetical protein